MKFTIIERKGSFGRHCNVAIWKIVLHCLMWCILRKRNARNFEDVEWSLIECKSFFFSSLLEWARALQVFPSVSFLDLLEFCSLRC